MSSGSINDIAIKLGIDATGVATGMKHATAEALRASRDVEKAESLEREYNIKQQLDDIDTANKARMKSEEAFSKWYAQTLEEEFQTWYQLELRKEKEAETFAVNRQQAAINQANAAINVSGPMPAETMDRALENDNLEAAIRERYRLMDEANEKEQKLAIARARDLKRLNDDARRQDLNDMRAAQAARERAIADADRREETQATIKLIRSQQRVANQARTQTQNSVTAQNNADIAAANRVIQQHLTLQERYAQEIARLTNLYNSYNIQTGRALLTSQQLARATTSVTIATIRQQQAQRVANGAMAQGANTARIMSGVITQASFAAEDFIQGMVFGDVRTALLGAANNLTMVVRGLLQINTASTAAATATGAVATGLAGIVAWMVAVPAAVIGLGSYILWLNRAKADTRDLQQVMSDLNDEWMKFNRLSSINAQGRSRALATGRLSSSDEAANRVNQLLDEQLELERRLQSVRNQVSRQNREIFEDTMGGAAALQELKDQIAKTIAFGSAEEIAAANEMSRLLGEAADASERGDFTAMTAAMAAMNNMANDGALRNWTEWIDDLASFDALQNLFDSGILGTFFKDAGTDQEALNAIRKTLADSTIILTEAEREMMILGEDLLKTRIKLHELAMEETNQARMKLKADQDEYLMLSKMTEAERELYDLRKAQEDFMGPVSSVMRGEGPLQEADQAAAIGFLEAQRDALRKDLEALVPEIIVKAGLEQSAMDAQAKAFDQMLQASAKKPDPQIERTNRLLESIDNAIKNGGRIEVIQ